MPMPPVREEGEPLLRADALAKTFHQSGQDVHALAGVSAEIWPGETLGLVGESGSGKTTLARVLLGITPPDEGGVLELDGLHAAADHRQAVHGAGARDPDRVPEPGLGAQPPALRADDRRPRPDQAGGTVAVRRARRSCST